MPPSLTLTGQLYGMGKWMSSAISSAGAGAGANPPKLPPPPKAVTQLEHDISELHRAHTDFRTFQTKMERLLTKLVDPRASPARQDLVKREFLVGLSRKVDPETSVSDMIRALWDDDTPGLFADTESFGWVGAVLGYLGTGMGIHIARNTQVGPFKASNGFTNFHQLGAQLGVGAAAGKLTAKKTDRRFKQHVDRMTRVHRTRRRSSASRSRSRGAPSP